MKILFTITSTGFNLFIYVLASSANKDSCPQLDKEK